MEELYNSSLFLPCEEGCGGRGLAVEGVPVSLRDPGPGAQHCCLHSRGGAGGGGGVQLLIGGGAGHGDHPGHCWRLSPEQTLYYRQYPGRVSAPGAAQTTTATYTARLLLLL